MIRLTRSKFFSKRPRRSYHPRPKPIRCGENGWFCSECMENFAAEAEYERPGHIWAIGEGKIVYLEDKIAESMLGRPLNANEVVVHRDGNVRNNIPANLEIITMPDMGSK